MNLPKVKVSGEDFTLILKDKLQNSKPRIVVSKKVASLAVDRNRIKRLFREALRAIGQGGNQATIIVKKNISENKMNQIKQNLEKLLKKNV